MEYFRQLVREIFRRYNLRQKIFDTNFPCRKFSPSLSKNFHEVSKCFHGNKCAFENFPWQINLYVQFSTKHGILATFAKCITWSFRDLKIFDSFTLSMGKFCIQRKFSTVKKEVLKIICRKSFCFPKSIWNVTVIFGNANIYMLFLIYKSLCLCTFIPIYQYQLKRRIP